VVRKTGPGSCTCGCHSIDLESEALDGAEDDKESSESRTAGERSAGVHNSVKVAKRQGCTRVGGCRPDGDCAQEDGELLNNGDGVTTALTESDADFEE